MWDSGGSGHHEDSPLEDIYQDDMWEDPTFQKKTGHSYIKQFRGSLELIDSYKFIKFKMHQIENSKGLIFFIYSNNLDVSHHAQSLAKLPFNFCLINISQVDEDVNALKELINELWNGKTNPIIISLQKTSIVFEVMNMCKINNPVGIILIGPEKKNIDILGKYTCPILLFVGQKGDGGDWKAIRDAYIKSQSSVKKIRFWKSLGNELSLDFAGLEIDNEIRKWILDLKINE